MIKPFCVMMLMAVSVLCAPRAVAVTLLNDTFTDAEKDTQNLPTSAAWYVTSGSNNLVATTGALVMNSDVARQETAYFVTATNAPVILSSGQTISVSLNISTNYSGTDIRLGLFDSNTTRIGNGTSAGANSTWDGYFAAFSASGATIRDRTSDVTSLFSASSGSALGGGSVITPSTYAGFASGTNYTLTLSYTYASATSGTVELTLASGATTLMDFTKVDTSGAFTSFDTFSLYAGGGPNAIPTPGNYLTIDNVLVTVVPEPSTMVLGFAGLGFILLRARHRSQTRRS